MWLSSHNQQKTNWILCMWGAEPPNIADYGHLYCGTLYDLGWLSALSHTQFVFHSNGEKVDLILNWTCGNSHSKWTFYTYRLMPAELASINLCENYLQMYQKSPDLVIPYLWTLTLLNSEPFNITTMVAYKYLSHLTITLRCNQLHSTVF